MGTMETMGRAMRKYSVRWEKLVVICGFKLKNQYFCKLIYD